MENENGPPEGAEAKADPTMAAAAASAPSNNSGCEGSSVSASSSNGSGGSVTSVLWRMMNEDRSTTTNKSSDNESDIYDAKGLKLSSITNEEIDDIIVTKEGNNWASDSSEISSNGGSEEGGRSSPKAEDGRQEVEAGEGKELAKVETKLGQEEDQKVAVAARVTQDSNREDVQGASSTSDRQWQQQPRRSPAMQAQLEHLLSLYRQQRKSGDAAMRGRTAASGCTSDIHPDGGPAAPPSSSTSDRAAAVDDHDGTKDESLDILCQMIIEGKGSGCGSKGGSSKDGSSNASGSSLTGESSESGSDAGDVPDSGGEGGGGVDLDNL